jgi:prevent-host-death family protein
MSLEKCSTLKHMKEVGIRALKQNASQIVAEAAAGEVVIITDRGRPVAQITPLPKSRMQQLIDAGLVRLPTRDLADLPPPVPGPSLSEEILRMREERL